MVTVKICGITRLEDAERCLALDVEWLGLNFWPGSKRRCGLSEARRIVDAVGERARVVGVFVDASVEAMRNVLAETGVGWAQLHGEESVETLDAMLPHAFKALRATGPAVLELARRYGGEHLLLDAHAPGTVGGTGVVCDWDLAAELARVRPLTLAGGLTAENVGAAIAHVRPARVDVASGVESAPGHKDAALLAAFVSAVRHAG